MATTNIQFDNVLVQVDGGLEEPEGWWEWYVNSTQRGYGTTYSESAADVIASVSQFSCTDAQSTTLGVTVTTDYGGQSDYDSGSGSLPSGITQVNAGSVHVWGSAIVFAANRTLDDVSYETAPQVSKSDTLVISHAVPTVELAGGVSPREVNVSDTLVVTDTPTTVVNRVVVSTDTLTASETLALQVTRNLSVLETLNFSDSVTVHAPPLVVVTDTVTLSETPILVLELAIAVSDAVTTSDSRNVQAVEEAIPLSVNVTPSNPDFRVHGPRVVG